MRFLKKDAGGDAEIDMTPMIDVVFQLISFFMFAINFAQAEQDERIRLPDSVLAKPPDTPLEYPITLNMTKHGSVIFGGQELFLEGLPLYLRREAALLENRERQVNDATVIIRADKDAATGEVQRLVNVCQEQGFAKFALRAKEDVGN